MKKMKKWIVPLLVMLLVPLTLAGCSFGKTTPQKSLSDGQLWYVIDPNEKDDVMGVLGKIGNKLGYISLSNEEVPFSTIEKAKNLKEVSSLLKKTDAKNSADYTTFSPKYSIVVDGEKNSVAEVIQSDNSNIVGFSNQKITMKKYGLSGFKLSDEFNSQIGPQTSDTTYFVTKSKKAELDDSKNKNITVWDKSNEEELANQNGYNND